MSSRSAKRLSRGSNAARRPSLKLIHAKVPGRVRFEIPRLYRDEVFCVWLRSEILGVEGVTGASLSPLSTTALIIFDFKRIKHKQLGVQLEKLLRLWNRSRKKKEEPAALESAWHLLSLKALEKRLNTSLSSGLSTRGARAALEKYGYNRLPAPSARSNWMMARDQVSNLPSVLLIGSAVISLATGGVADTIVILGVVAINSYIGFATESSAEKVLSSLGEEWLGETDVIRVGKPVKIAASELVPGDVVLLSRGMAIPADARILESTHLSVDESSLTGESLPVDKLRGDRVFRGTLATGGSAKALVLATGRRSCVGRIQSLAAESPLRETPLQLQLKHLGNEMVIVSLGASALVLVAGILRGHRLAELLRMAVSLAIAAIPESLPTIATTTLARGIQSLEKEGLYVRRLDALETLGEVETVCLDKTGTLTLNQMTVAQISSRSPRELAKAAVLCNDAPDTESGSPTERALLLMAKNLGVDPQSLRSRHQLLETQYRTEDRAYMVTRHRDEKGEVILSMKGRPDEILERCDLTQKQRREILRRNSEMAAAGMRVLALATGSEDDHRWVWLGLVGMADPLRKNAAEWVRKLHEAGIRTVMITGDQEATARSVGKQLRLGRGAREIFSRVGPADKMKIIHQLQKSGQVVAMVGDGINDGPALRAADVGIALSGLGMFAAARSADILLLGEDLDKIVYALREGRRVQQDIRKAAAYILTQNFAEILFTLASVVLGLGELLTPAQLLWVNLVTDIFPELAIAQEPPEGDVMRGLPDGVGRHDRLFREGRINRMGIESAILAAFSIGAYSWDLMREGKEGLGRAASSAKTTGFLTLISGSLLYTLSARSENTTLFDEGRRPNNRYIPAAIGVGFAAEVAATYVPLLRGALGTRRVGMSDVLVSAVGSIAPLLLIEMLRVISRELQALEIQEGESYGTV